MLKRRDTRSSIPVEVEARLACYRDLIKSLTSHVIELRTLFLASDEDPRESLSPLKGLLSENDPEVLRQSVEDARRVLRSLLWSARQVREDERTQFREIGALVSATLKELELTDSKLTSDANTQLERLDDVVSGRSELSPRVALAVAVRHLRQAFLEHSRERKKQSRRMEALVTTLQSELREAKERGARDPLTGLNNRGAFDEELQGLLAKATIGFGGFGLIMCDIDHFKRINDQYGHPVGDQVLRHVADNIVRSCLRKDDFVARYGGEEFAIVLREVSLDGISRVAERLVSQIAQTPFVQKERRVSVTISCGAGLAAPDDTSGSILERVDAALYLAKSTGRNRVVCAPSPGTSELSEQLDAQASG